MHPEPREIWLADLGITAKTRPVVIVSRRDENPPRDLVIFIPCTSQYRSSKYEVALPRSLGFDRDTWANVQGIGAVPTSRLFRRIGKVKNETWEEIRAAIRYALDF